MKIDPIFDNKNRCFWGEKATSGQRGDLTSNFMIRGDNKKNYPLVQQKKRLSTKMQSSKNLTNPKVEINPMC